MRAQTSLPSDDARDGIVFFFGVLDGGEVVVKFRLLLHRLRGRFQVNAPTLHLLSRIDFIGIRIVIGATPSIQPI